MSDSGLSVVEPVGRGPSGTGRPPGLVVVALVAVAAAIVLIRGGGGEGGSVPSSTLDPVRALAEPSEPRLTDLVPELEESLELVALGPPSQYVVWALEMAEPVVRELPLTSGWAFFDVSGDFVAMRGPVMLGPGFGADLWLAPAGGPVRFAEHDVTTIAWHEDEGGRVALAQLVATGEDLQLITGRVDPGSGELTERETVGTLEPGSELIEWGEWGFAVASASTAGTSLVVLDSNSEPIRAINTVVLASGGGRMAVIAPAFQPDTNDASVEPAVQPTSLTIVDHTLNPVVGPLDQLDLPSRPNWAVMDQEGERVALGEIAPDGTTTVTFVDLTDREHWILEIVEPVRAIGFIQDGDILVLQGVEDPDLRLVAWDTRDIARVPTTSRDVVAARP